MRLIEELDTMSARTIRFVLMDIDDTMTTDGKLPAASYEALWRLHDAGLHAVPITGRPAGWCDLIARQWPVAGVVGENGALAFWEEEGKLRRLFHEQAVRNDHPSLQKISRRALEAVPGCRIAHDQASRLFDIAIDFAEEEPFLPLSDAQRIKAICEEEGAVAKISSIHVNTWMGRYDKLSMAVRLLAYRFSYDDVLHSDSVMFFGDSPNDEPMFRHFPCSVGVANVRHYGQMMTHWPAYVTVGDGGQGFAEGVRVLLDKRRQIV